MQTRKKNFWTISSHRPFPMFVPLRVKRVQKICPHHIRIQCMHTYIPTHRRTSHSTKRKTTQRKQTPGKREKKKTKTTRPYLTAKRGNKLQKRSNHVTLEFILTSAKVKTSRRRETTRRSRRVLAAPRSETSPSVALSV